MREELMQNMIGIVENKNENFLSCMRGGKQARHTQKRNAIRKTCVKF